MSYYSLIYGSVFEEIKMVYPDIEYVDDEPLIKIYSLPLYGCNKCDDEENMIVGIEYGRIYNLYENAKYTYDNKMQISDATIPDKIKHIFDQKYPNIKGKYYAVIQNVYTSHYVSGLIMYGYWILSENVLDLDTEILLGDVIYSYNDIDNEYDIIQCGHNMKHTPSKKFIGKILSYLDETETGECCESLAKKFRKINSTENIEILSTEDLHLSLNELAGAPLHIRFSPAPMIAVIQTMCHCCT